MDGCIVPGVVGFLALFELGSWNSLIGSVVELYKRGASIVSCFIVSNTKIIIISSLPSIFCCFATCHAMPCRKPPNVPF